jgi:uncharacterized membrane protein YhhN
MRSTFLGIVFLLLCIVHLTACLKKLDNVRRLTKPFLLLLLSFWYLSFAKEPRVLIFTALILGMIGDIFLLFTEKPALMKGGMAAFGLGHICYAAAFIKDTVRFDPVIIAIIAVVYVVSAAFLFRSFRKYMPKEMLPPSALYIILISVMSASALVRFVSAPSVGSFLPALGSWLFVVSDTLLTSMLFKAGTKQGNYSVMLTYLLAQALIAFGMANIIA